MENRKAPSKKELRNQEEKRNSQAKCGALRADPGLPKRRFLQDSRIPQSKTNPPKFLGVQVTVRPRSPAIKTLFLAEKSRFNSAKGSETSRSLLAIGDHLPFSTRLAKARSNSARSVGDKKLLKEKEISCKTFNKHFVYRQEERLSGKPNYDKSKLRSAEKCYIIYAQHNNANHQKLKENFDKQSIFERKSRKFINADCSDNKNLSASIEQVDNRIQLLKSLVRRQEMVLGDFNSQNSLSSSDEESRVNMISRASGTARPGCSYIENYSHIPETSAFQRYAQQPSSLSHNKGATLEKEHNSEQYGRDFTAYDGLTARRRQCSSATSKRDDVPLAAERMIKIRHKLNPVRDYRLMDTVHYLAQGEFAPRNDGIKLTPSREAVLSDIIWEDVCRTHWPTARLARRHAQQDRGNARNELQRLIDSLLRERVAHVERRRRRHYRVVKHTQHSAGRVGKTDIIVASHKHKHRDESDIPTGHTHHASGLMMTSNRWPDHRTHRSDDRLVSPERRRVLQEDCTPGPSYAAPRSRREPTCCYQAAGTSKQPARSNACQYTKENKSSSSTVSSERNRTTPRLVVKKDSSRKKHHEKELNLEHFILLPTLVVRTPSNVRRQKKFNELYHRILNQLSTEQNTETTPPTDHSHRNTKKESVTSIDKGKNK